MSFWTQVVLLAVGMILLREADTSGSLALDFVMSIVGILLLRHAYTAERGRADA